MALSQLSIEKLLKDDELRIQYAFTSGGSRPTRAPGRVNLDEVDHPQTQFFRQNASGCRLQLTVGPYARSHVDFSYSGRTTVGKGGIVDLQEHGSLTVEPRETITLLTNEYVEFPNTHWALVTPRVTMTDAGFLMTTAYIDPGYRGLLRVTLHNATNFRQVIKLCEPIAQMFVAEVEGAVDPRNKDHLANRSVFYGTNWDRLFDDAVEPFPRRKIPLESLRMKDRVGNWFRDVKTRGSAAVKAIGVLAVLSLTLGALVSYGTFREQLAQIDGLEHRIEEAVNARPQLGQEPFSFSGTSTELRVPVLAGIDLSRAQTFTELQEGGSGLFIRSHLEPTSAGLELKIQIFLSPTSDSSKSYIGKVSWAIIP